MYCNLYSLFEFTQLDSFPMLFVFSRPSILQMTGLNTSVLQAKNTITTAEQKFRNGKNRKSGLKGMCVHICFNL